MHIIHKIVVSFADINGNVIKQSSDFELVSREEWGARPPILVENMTNPVDFVIIHHSYIPAACNTTKECIQAMQWMQTFHMVHMIFLASLSFFYLKKKHRLYVKSF